MMTEWMNKWLMAIFCWMIFMPVPDLLAQSAKTKDDPRITLRMKEVSLPEVLSEIERQAGVTFSYESSLLKELPKISFQVKDEALTDCLTRLFESYPIVYKVSGKIVILKRRQRQVTISGFVRDQASSESLIGASVYEVASRKGSATNSYGFFSLTLPPGNIRLHASYIGYESCSFNFTELDRDTLLNIELRPNARLEEVVVTASERDRLSVNNTLMGTMEFSQKTIKATPTLFGESDIVKTLQLTPGVASGTEGLAGLYVRGGDQDGNLFLIDGNPVYQINHVGGLFSAFNPEAIRNLDFFKAGFPARYGGRLSSVVDVHTKEGNMKEYHGSATIGLISGNLSLEGPIIKDRTAFQIALRRSWLDVLSAPAIAIANKLDQYDKRTGRFDHFTVQDGLSGNIVRGIREGEPGILFVSTNKGLSRLDIQNRHIVNYTTANGLLSNEFMGGACCKRKSGELVFGSNEGIVSFDPVQLTDGLRKIPESLRITNLTIGDSREKQGLQVGFIAFDYSHPRSIRYRYRLDGYDTDWREVDASDRTAIYNRLPPGNYVFRVETSGNGSYWSAPITEPVRIFPPWWRTWWFILLVFVVVCVLLCIAYKSRVRWYQLRQAELERKIQERTRLLKQAKQELEEKDALKTRFFMNVSHELRTPLTIIKGLTEDLERHSGSEVSCGDKEILRTISRNTNRLIRHVNELLDLSVLTRGVPSPHIVCADLSRFLEEISETFIPLADSYKIAFTYSIAPDISIAYFDKNILEQVLYNLLSNAFKYTPDGGSVSFSASLEQSSSDAVMTLRITDSGIGIPPESLPYIFDRYYKGASIAFRRSESSGIGLAYTKELLELHKATIQCESELGKGSVFTVALPISEEAYPEEWLEYSESKMEEVSLRESVPLEETNSVPENLRQTLLFVEDNEDLCRYLMNAFQTDYRVVIAKNGKVGLEKALEILPDVIVSDVMMPVMNGIECCEALKTDERTAHIPVILLTALAEERQQLEGYGAGADDYLPKPFSLAVLKAKIKNLLKRSEQLKLYFRDRFDLRTPEQTIADPDKEFLSKVTKVVLAHLQDPEFDVELFCSEMAMSRASLFRKLKSTTGCSASSFTRNIRIKRAAELLGQHAYSIGEVAAQVGFSDPNYFTRCFKEIYGITPSEFIQTSPSSQDSHSPLASSGK